MKLQDAACLPLSRLPGHPGLVPKTRPRRGSPGHPGPVVRDGVSRAASKTGGEARLVLATPPGLQGLVALRTLDGQTLLSWASPHKGARARSAASSSRALWARRKTPPPALNKEPFAGAHAATPRRRPPRAPRFSLLAIHAECGREPEAGGPAAPPSPVPRSGPRAPRGWDGGRPPPPAAGEAPDGRASAQAPRWEPGGGSAAGPRGPPDTKMAVGVSGAYAPRRPPALGAPTTGPPKHAGPKAEDAAAGARLGPSYLVRARRRCGRRMRGASAARRGAGRAVSLAPSRPAPTLFNRGHPRADTPHGLTAWLRRPGQ